MTERVVDLVLTRVRHAARRAPLVAVSGIDGAGKTRLTAGLAERLAARGVRAAVITVDPWHTPAAMRFNAADPARHFYRYAFRWDELFARLIEPLRRRRSLSLTLPLLRLRDDHWYEHAYEFRDVDVVVLEGIFLLRRRLRWRYDIAVWVEASFETALRRALARNQEGVPEAVLRRDYATVYFPAERIHFRRDRPQAGADVVVDNETQANASSSAAGAGASGGAGISASSLVARPQSTIL